MNNSLLGNPLVNTPLQGLNYSFARYVEDKKNFERRHLDGHGLPDYAYKMDFYAVFFIRIIGDPRLWRMG
jgi:hypothetical protein